MSIADQFKPAREGPQVRDLDLDLSAIKLDQSAQPRESLNNDRIAEYAEAMKVGDQFPPLTVFHDGETYWLADGFHRHYAAQHAGSKHVRCYVRQGGLRDAILWSVGANAKHGLARSDEDKKRAVIRLLEDAEWSTWTDRDIAKRCRVSHPFVAKIRKAHAGVTGNITSERTYRTKHGTTATMKTAGINASRKNAPEGPRLNDEPYPEAGPQAEASPVGTDAGTPADREGRREEEAASVDLPTISDAVGDTDAIRAGHITRYHVMQLRGAWSKANAEARAIFLAEFNLSFIAAPGVAAEATGNDLREPVAAEQGQIVREGDAPREIGRQEDDDDRRAGGVASSPDTEFPSAATPAVTVAEPQAPQAATADIPDPQASSSRQADKGDGAPPPASSPAHRWSSLRPHCLNPELCAGVGAKHCHACEKAMAEGEAA